MADEQLIIDIEAEIGKLSSGLDEANQKIDEMGRKSEEASHKGNFLSNAFSFATGGLITSGIGAITGSLGGLLDGMIGGSAQMENYNTQFEVMTGSMDNAKKLMGDLQTMGANTPFEFTDLAQSTQTLLSFGAAQKDIIPDLQMLGDISGGNAEKLQSLSLVFGQIESNGKMMGGDLLQLINAGFNPLNDISKTTGKSMSELRDEMSKGEISYDMVKQAMQHATSEGGQFNGMMDKQSTTFSGLMSTLQDNFNQALRTFGAPIFDKLKEGLQWLVGFLSSPGVQGAISGFAQMLSDGIGNAVQFVGGVINKVWPIIQPFFENLLNFWKQIASGGDPFAALGGYINNLLGMIGSALPGIIAQLGQWAQAFWNWIVQAMPGVLSGLGTLIGSVLSWIGTNGPSILAQLAIWTGAFLNWALTDLLPKLMGWLGQIIQGIWTWITTNGPGILAQLAQWTQAFFNWVMTDVLPKLPGWLMNIVTAVWTFITQNGPPILAKLWEWTQAFFKWVWEDVLPKLPGWLWNIVSAVWNFITENGPKILAKLGEWTGAFLNWVMTDVLPKVPGWLGNIASALWTWITNTAKDLGSHLVNEWLPAFWNWITGPDGVIAHLGSFLGQIVSGIWDWITTTAKNIVGKVQEIGGNIVQGIKNGISGAWDAFVNWVTGLLGGMVDAVKKFFGISSPSKLMQDEVGNPLMQGLAMGIDAGAPAAYAAMNKVWDGLWGIAASRSAQIAALGGPGVPTGEDSSNAGGAGSGGTGGKMMASGGPVTAGVPYIVGEKGPELFVPSQSGTIVPNSGSPGAVLMGASTVIQIFVDGMARTPAEASALLGADFRVSVART